MVDDIVPLSERLSVLHFVRLAIALTASVAAVAVPTVFAVPVGTVVAMGVLYAGVTSVIELTRRRFSSPSRLVVTAMILLDGVYLVMIVIWTGGVFSVFLAACYVMIAAVTMLLSYRTGLKIALWYGLIFCAADAAVEAGWLPAGVDADWPLGRVAVTVATFLLFAISTALFASFNEWALRRSRGHFRTLADLGIALELEVREPRICCVIAERTAKGLGFTRVAVLSIDRHTAVGAVHTAKATTMVELPAALLESGAAGDALATHRLVMRDVRDQDDDDALVDLILPSATRVVAVPLRADGENVAILLAEWPHSSRLPQPTADVLMQMAVHGTLALRNGRLLAELDRLAARDALTGLGNRRSFQEVLDREIARARRDASPLSLAIFDIDHFKLVNDAHGHLVGDQVLRAVARVLSSGVRGADLASRYGGEEFIVLLPGAGKDDAGLTADRLRLDVQDGPSPVPVTASAGVATFPEQAATGAQLVAIADRALYEAKRRGRNRVVAATGPTNGARTDTDTDADRAAPRDGSHPTPAYSDTHPSA